jgi:hypothetical protein
MLRKSIYLSIAVLSITALLIPTANTQTGKPIMSTTATVSNLDLTHGTATIEILNQSNKDITAYAVAYEGVLQDHHVIQGGERLMDYGSLLAAKHQTLRPGEISTQPVQFFPKPNNPLTAVRATVVAVVFADQTSEASSPDALDRIVAARTEMVLMGRISVGALEKALADTNPHPGALAGKTIRDRIAQTPNLGASASGPGISKEFMQHVAQEFEDAPNRAAATGITEREHLTQRLADLRQRLQEDEAYSQIRRQP